MLIWKNLYVKKEFAGYFRCSPPIVYNARKCLNVIKRTKHFVMQNNADFKICGGNNFSNLTISITESYHKFKRG